MPTTSSPPTATSTTHPTPHTTYEDRAVGGAGLDVLIANTGGDRLIDWVGEFNTFLVPFSPFGMATVSRQVPPGLMDFLYRSPRRQGADPTLAQQAGADADRATASRSARSASSRRRTTAWGDQTGGPRDPQAGNVNGGRRDVLRAADFNAGSIDGFLVDSGALHRHRRHAAGERGQHGE